MVHWESRKEMIVISSLVRDGLDMDNEEIINQYERAYEDSEDRHEVIKDMLNEARADERAKCYAEKLTDKTAETISDAVNIGIDLAKPNPIIKEIIAQTQQSERAKIVEMLEKDAKLLEDFKTISAGNKAEALRTAIQKIKEQKPLEKVSSKEGE